MSSKYEPYWRGHISELRSAIENAAAGHVSELDVSGLTALGDRASWSGTTTVVGRKDVSGGMAHATALGRVVGREGLLDQWPATVFVFSITAGLKLRIKTGGAPHARRKGGVLPREPIRREGKSSDPGSRSASSNCERVHGLLARLPLYTSPEDVPFKDGLYFFYETGEDSQHARSGRIVRVGNHPRSAGRLRPRLRDHYRTKRNAKNFSVFRRYLGGALLRRADSHDPCLLPLPGRGHWELQDGDECIKCEATEAVVSENLASRFRFRCVRIDDMELRNRLEAGLIASLAGCTDCRPSPSWLGHSCYQVNVRESGLWNKEFVGGSPLTDLELSQFGDRVDATLKEINPAMALVDDLSDTLLVIPCCKSKNGIRVPELPRRSVGEFFGEDERARLDQGRTKAWENPKTSIDESSVLRSALAWYTGQPYKTLDFRDLLIEALGRGLHCLIVSGGYGLLRPEESIHKYDAYLPTQTWSVWQPRLAHLLPAYVERQRIRRAFITMSRSYASCLPRGFAPDEWWAIPDSGLGSGAISVRVGQLATGILSSAFEPSEGWVRR